MSPRTSWLAMLILIVVAGCTPSERMQPANYQPNVAVDDPGPWPIVMNRHFYSYWVSAGPYRTNWIGMAPTIPVPEGDSIENLVTVQPVSHSEDALGHKIEVTDVNSGTVLLRSFAEPETTYLTLGKLEIPVDQKIGKWRGNICTINQEIARFGFADDDSQNDDILGQIVLNDRVITARNTPEPEKSFLQQMTSNGFLSIDYMDGSRRVGFLEWRPDKRLWIDPGLPADARLAIAARAALTVTQFEAFDRQQAAANTPIYIPAN
jgi:hypothetical protein